MNRFRQSTTPTSMVVSALARNKSRVCMLKCLAPPSLLVLDKLCVWFACLLGAKTNQLDGGSRRQVSYLQLLNDLNEMVARVKDIGISCYRFRVCRLLVVVNFHRSHPSFVLRAEEKVLSATALEGSVLTTHRQYQPHDRKWSGDSARAKSSNRSDSTNHKA